MLAVKAETALHAILYPPIYEDADGVLTVDRRDGWYALAEVLVFAVQAARAARQALLRRGIGGDFEFHTGEVDPVDTAARYRWYRIYVTPRHQADPLYAACSVHRSGAEGDRVFYMSQEEAARRITSGGDFRWLTREECAARDVVYKMTPNTYVFGRQYTELVMAENPLRLSPLSTSDVWDI